MQNRLPIAAGLDAFVVVAFVAIGRRNHDENPGIAGLVDTAAPFVLGLALAWTVARAWNRRSITTEYGAGNADSAWERINGIGMLRKGQSTGGSSAIGKPRGRSKD